MASLLLEHGADPYLNTTPKNGVSFTYNRGGLSAFSMAAMHGHRCVQDCDVMLEMYQSYLNLLLFAIHLAVCFGGKVILLRLKALITNYVNLIARQFN